MNNEYQPKGGMCATCEHRQRNCSNLDFKSMQVLSSWITQDRTTKHHVVRCADFSDHMLSTTTQLKEDAV